MPLTRSFLRGGYERGPLHGVHVDRQLLVGHPMRSWGS
jgi:hypothetical protein